MIPQNSHESAGAHHSSRGDGGICLRRRRARHQPGEVDINSLLNGLKASASPMALGVALLAGPALAQTADATKPAADNTQVQEVIVTGSLIKRTNIETPSPVTVLTLQELKTSGFDALSSALSNVTANGCRHG